MKSNIIVPLEITLQNFLSYGNDKVIIKLDHPDPILIVGENHDAAVDGEIDSNGAGKSAVLNAIAFCVYDKTISVIKKDKLINFINKKDMYVSFVFKKGNIYHKIERWRKNAGMGADGVRLMIRKGKGKFIPETHDKTPDSISNTNAKLASIFGMPYAVFSRVGIISARMNSFLSLELKDQRSIMEELCSFTELTHKAKSMGRQISLDKKDLEALMQLNDQIKENRDRYTTEKTQVDTDHAEWEVTHSESCEEYKKSIKKLNRIKFSEQQTAYEEITTENKRKADIENKITTREALIRERRADIKRFTEWEDKKLTRVVALEEGLKEYDDLDFTTIISNFDQLSELKTQNKENAAKKAQCNTEIKQIELVVAEKEAEYKKLTQSKCPYCKQDFQDAKDKMITVLADVKVKVKDLKSLDAELDVLEKIEASLEAKTINIPSTKYATKTEAINAQSMMNRSRDRLEDTRNEVCPMELDVIEEEKEIVRVEATIVSETEAMDLLSKELDLIRKKFKFESIEELNQKKFLLKSQIQQLDEKEKEINPYTKMKDHYSKVEIEEDKSNKIDEMHKKLEHKMFVHKLLTRKDSFIRKALLNKSIPFLNTRLMYYLEKLRLPHKVEFLHDMTVRISQFGNELGFGNLSSGQEARVNLALSFAFRDLL